MCGARLLSVFRQVGAHLWHEGPAGGLSGFRTYNLLTLACLEVQALPLSHRLLLSLMKLRSFLYNYSTRVHINICVGLRRIFREEGMQHSPRHAGQQAVRSEL